MAKEFKGAINRILRESNFDLDDDVDFLVKELGIDTLIEDYKKNPETSRLQKMVTGSYSPSELDTLETVPSNKLPSRNAQISNTKKPIKFVLKCAYGSHQYSPDRDETLFVIPFGVVKKLGESGLGNESVLAENPHWRRYFNLSYWRSVIAHELTHWMEDALYGGKVTKAIERFRDEKRRLTGLSNKRGEDRPARLDQIDRLELNQQISGPEEIEGLIAQLKQLYRSTDRKVWDEMTFEDLYEMDPILKHYLNRAKHGKPSGSKFRRGDAALTDEQFDSFVRTLVKKMNRAGILGTNMRNPTRRI